MQSLHIVRFIGIMKRKRAMNIKPERAGVEVPFVQGVKHIVKKAGVSVWREENMRKWWEDVRR